MLNFHFVDPPDWKANPSYVVPSPLRVRAMSVRGDAVPIPTLPLPSTTNGVESAVLSVSVIMTLNASDTVSSAVIVCLPANAKVLPSNVRLASPFRASALLKVAILLLDPFATADTAPPPPPLPVAAPSSVSCMSVPLSSVK